MSELPPAYEAEEPGSRLQDFCEAHEISGLMERKLHRLKDFDVALICDDSGSMTTPLKGEKHRSRWDELKETVALVAELAACLDDDGIDVHFLNREIALRGVTSASQVRHAFADDPRGFTNIVKAMGRVLAGRTAYSKPLLLVVFTDGEPTNALREVDREQLGRALRERPRDVFTTLVACTDDATSVAYMNDWDGKIERLDVCDDFESERAQIQKVQGSRFPFSRGDYCAKLLLGSIDAEVDALDEKKTQLK